MYISFNDIGRVLLMSLDGRFDGLGAREAEEALKQRLTKRPLCLVIDMEKVGYLSSAGVRVLMAAAKLFAARGGTSALASVQGYCKDVLEMSGVTRHYPNFPDVESALAHCRAAARDQETLEAWNTLQASRGRHGKMTFIPGSDKPGDVLVLGHVEDVLNAAVTRERIHSKHFSDAEYSIGLGGLGRDLADYYRLMGEMITIGGTMVWLPADGNDIPDFLTPRTDTGAVTIRTSFNVSISGAFNEVVLYQSHDQAGTRIGDLYQDLFDQAKDRRKDFKGALALAVWADAAEVYGSAIKIAPVAELAPDNGKPVTDPVNVSDWFQFDSRPRFKNVTCLMCGVGLDLKSDISAYDGAMLKSVFYLNPANPSSPVQTLHNHGVVFEPVPMPDRLANLDKEIRKVVGRGKFLDMRHLLDDTRFTRAFIGVSYTQAFKPDPAGVQGAGPGAEEKLLARAKELYGRKTDEQERREAADIAAYLQSTRRS